MTERPQNELMCQDHLDQNQFFSACAASGGFQWRLWRLCANATHTAAFRTFKRREHTFFARYLCPERESKSQGFSSLAQCITVLVLDSQIMSDPIGISGICIGICGLKSTFFCWAHFLYSHSYPEFSRGGGLLAPRPEVSLEAGLWRILSSNAIIFK